MFRKYLDDNKRPSTTTIQNKQSPINLSTLETKFDENLLTIGQFEIDYRPGDFFELINTGHSWQVNLKADSNSTIHEELHTKGKYKLAQFHCHWGSESKNGSEHTINGVGYAAEVHFVHWKLQYGSFQKALEEPDGLLVFGVLLQETKVDNPNMDNLVKRMVHIKHKGDKVRLLGLEAEKLLPTEFDYWTYEGSLTTPPFTECVRWVVFKTPVGVSSQQIGSFRSLSAVSSEEAKVNPISIVNNVRPVQPLNYRLLRSSFEINQANVMHKDSSASLKTCQSPIDFSEITTKYDSSLKTDSISFNYSPDEFVELTNTGHSWQINLKITSKSNFRATYLNGDYELLQLHCTWGTEATNGSEHAVNGQRYAAEIHFVHWKTQYGKIEETLSKKDGLAVVAVFLQESDKDNEFFDELVTLMDRIKYKENYDFWTYNGSLTTLPFTECVLWTVFRTPVPISKRQLDKFRTLLAVPEDSKTNETFIVNNVRPVQHLNNRSVRSSFTTREL